MDQRDHDKRGAMQLRTGDGIRLVRRLQQQRHEWRF